MTEQFTPTTEEVRERTAFGRLRGGLALLDPYQRQAAFDRWLRDVKAQAWAEGHSAGLWASPDSAKDNPYREGSE